MSGCCESPSSFPVSLYEHPGVRAHPRAVWPWRGKDQTLRQQTLPLQVQLSSLRTV